MNINVIGSLCVEVLQDCNLSCDFCMKGQKTKKRMTKEVIERLFYDIKYIDTLVLTGGEITLATNEIYMILKTIKDHNIIINKAVVVVNGTIYNEELFNLIEDNISNFEIYISSDYFHDKSIKETYDDVDKIMENQIKIINHPNFCGFDYLSNYILDEGNAKKLDNIKKEKTPFLPFITFCKKNQLYVGPEIFIDVDGNLANANSEYIKNNNNILGNILNQDLYYLLKKQALKSNYKTLLAFNLKCIHLQNNYFYSLGKNYVIKNGKVEKEKRTITNCNCDTNIYDKENRLIKKYMKRSNL